VFGYGGKQVRDNIHSLDVAQFMYEFYKRPRIAQVYNLGGGKENSCSILEAFGMVEKLTGIEQRHTYVDQNRMGDHVCYYSDIRKMREHYPGWNVTKSLKQIVEEIVLSWERRLAASSS
jgi:CDP-paratose 2-epimerase